MEHAEATWEGKGVGEGVAFEHAFEDFFGLEQERLLRVLWLVTGSLQEAEDIVQDTFLRVWERWPDIGSMESPSGQHSLVVLNSDGTETQVAHAETITGGSFTPEGSKVVYGVTVGGKHWKSGIYVVDADGGTPQLLYAAARRRIAREAYPTDVFQLAVYSPTLSPDGSRIAYIEGMGDWGNSLWVMNADGTDRHRIIAWEEGNELVGTGSLQWSPDGTRLAFEGFGHEGAGIRVVNSDGSALTVFARGSDLRVPRAPYWSPDGSRIAFQRSTPEGGFQSDGTLYTMTPDGDDVQSLGHNELPFGVLLGPWNPLVPRA